MFVYTVCNKFSTNLEQAVDNESQCTESLFSQQKYSCSLRLNANIKLATSH